MIKDKETRINFLLGVIDWLYIRERKTLSLMFFYDESDEVLMQRVYKMYSRDCVKSESGMHIYEMQM